MRSLLVPSLVLALSACIREGAAPTAEGLADGPDVARHTVAGSGSGSAPADMDGDGVLLGEDCDDGDARLGALLYEDDLASDADWLNTTPQLDTAWSWSGTSVFATDGGQQALVGAEQSWGDVAIFATLSARGTRVDCGFDCEESCGDPAPDDCWTTAEALGLGALTATSSASGVVTFSNSSAYDICMDEALLWDGAATQGVFLGEEDAEGEYRVPAGGSLDVYYGSWTTDNGTYSPYLDEPDLWCVQHGTSWDTVPYETTGALVPDLLTDWIFTDNDADGDGVEDHVDWQDYTGVQAQYDVWDTQEDHAVVLVGKRAQGGAGAVTVTLDLQNRGALATTATVTDYVPAAWSLVSCDVTPDAETLQSDGTVALSWTVDLGGCTADCGTVEELEITCTMVHQLSTDVDRLSLPQAQATWDSGEGDVTSWSVGAVAFDYDHNGDGEITCGETDRWRAGVLGRATLDEDQGEGFHGYRCALARNSTEDCFDSGHFLQIAEFMDQEEDDVASECDESCPENTTFDQLARVDHAGGIDLGAGDTAELEFWLYGTAMTCAATDGVDTVVATATDDSFAQGTVGLSTLNMFGDYDHLRVCEALSDR